MHTWVCEQRRGGHPVWAGHKQWKLPDRAQMSEYQAEGRRLGRRQVQNYVYKTVVDVTKERYGHPNPGNEQSEA